MTSGSQRVFGSGSPDQPDGCIEICAVGPNLTFDGCTGDDEPLGSGGTDETGQFQQNGQPGIMLNRPLAPGDLVCTVDTCDPAESACLLVFDPALAPALEWRILCLAAALLALFGLHGIGRLRRLAAP